MSYFAVHYVYTSTPGALEADRPAHREFLGSLVGGALVASGPYVGVSQPSALLIFRADSADEVASLLDRDPFWLAGLITDRRIEEWNPLIGVFAER